MSSTVMGGVPSRNVVRFSRVALALFALSISCGRSVSAARKGRKEPVCATQDCATGKVLDDGCDEKGRCVSCINA
jgi:hypothetical protein